MKKQLSYALLTISIISFNVLPAEAVNDILKISQDQTEAYAPGQWCVWFPWLGEICVDL